MRPRPFAGAGRQPSSSSSSSRQLSVRVTAGWGAPVTFSPGKLVKNKPAAEGLHALLLDAGALAAGYAKAGQFVQLKVADTDKPGFFAIASPPEPNNAGMLELLVKSQPGSTAEALCKLGEGSQVSYEGGAERKAPSAGSHCPLFLSLPLLPPGQPLHPPLAYGS